MLRRQVQKQLEEFMSSDVRKCALVQGARQVGKTYSVDALAADSEQVESYIKINFLETPELMKIFSGNLDVDTLILNFSLYLPDKKFIPYRTLLFLDEIQECPEAITSLKFWAQDHRFKVIASGSMLGIDYKRPTSYPVGSLIYIDMYPLNFREFLWALDVDDKVMDVLQECFTLGQPVPMPIHERLMNDLRLYMVIGGMPDVVQTWLDTHDMSAVDSRQRGILKDYQNDIAHYAQADIKIKAEACYRSIPAQLSKENHKFQYSQVEKGGTARKYGSSLDWLTRASLVYPCHNVSTVEFPLQSFADDASYRLYPGDIGLLVAMFDYSMKAALLAEDSVRTVLRQAKGAIYEALVADILIKNGHTQLYYYKNDTRKIEIEFLLEDATGVIPVEVKAGNNRSRSLDAILRQEDIQIGYKLIAGNVGASDKKVTLPLYMAMFL